MSFGDVAVQAVNKILIEKMTPPMAWQSAVESTFQINSTSIQKGCPRNAFLGLCEEGLVKGVEIEQYTRSDLNKAYAIKAVEILKEKEKEFKTKELWIEVLKRLDSDVSKAHNSQMDVVIALWKAGMIR